MSARPCPPPPDAPGPGLVIAPHVRACQVDGQVILLDLLHARYIGLSGSQLGALARSVQGWPAQVPAPTVPIPDVLSTTSRLLARGLLTRSGGDPPSITCLPEPVASPSAAEVVDAGPFGWSRWLRFLHSATSASVALKCRSLLAITAAVTERRSNRIGGFCDAANPDALRNAAAAYERMRPLLFTSRSRCLRDSLALVHFLAHEGFYPHWSSA